MMKIILSNYGHKYIIEQLKKSNTQSAFKNPTNKFLIMLLGKKIIHCRKNSHIRELLKDGFIEELKTKMDIRKIELHYKRNPLEYVRNLGFEISTRCNFHCMHCRNGYMVPKTDKQRNSIVDRFSTEVWRFIGQTT